MRASLSEARADLFRAAAMRSWTCPRCFVEYVMGLLTECADGGASSEATIGGSQSLRRVAPSSTRLLGLRFSWRRRLLDSAKP